jgi:tight adherence protein B
MDMMTLTILMIGLAFGLLVIGLVFQRREQVAAAALDQRLERYGAHGSANELDDEAKDTNFVSESVGRAVQNREVGRNMQRLLSRADIKMTVGEFMIARIAAAGAGAMIGFILGRGFTEPLMGVVVGAIVAIVGWMAPQWYVSRAATKRARQFNDQLGDTIGLMSNSLRAGYSLLQTMELASRETPEPMRTEFARVVREVGLGISPQQAMQNMLERVPSEDLDLLVTAINIQHEVGGNLAQILDVMGETIRERVRIKGEIQVLTAQGQISGYIITALPIAIAGFMFIINPDYIMELFAWPWICLPIAGLVMIVIGFFAMKKIVEIEV